MLPSRLFWASCGSVPQHRSTIRTPSLRKCLSARSNLNVLITGEQMSSKAQLEAVIAGYREELAVERLRYEKREDEWTEEVKLYTRQREELKQEIDRLDAEADRQEVTIIESEQETTRLQQEVERLRQPKTSTEAMRVPEPRMTELAQAAILTVAHMLENRAQAMSVSVGLDLDMYADLCASIHFLRSEVGWDVDPAVDQDAQALYEELTEPF